MINLYKQQKLSNIKINADELGFLVYQFSVDKIEFIEIMISYTAEDLSNNIVPKVSCEKDWEIEDIYLLYWLLESGTRKRC